MSTIVLPNFDVWLLVPVKSLTARTSWRRRANTKSDTDLWHYTTSISATYAWSWFSRCVPKYWADLKQISKSQQKKKIHTVSAHWVLNRDKGSTFINVRHNQLAKTWQKSNHGKISISLCNTHGYLLYLYNICVQRHLMDVKWTRIIQRREQATFSTNKLERFKNVASDLAQIWKTVTKLDVGNKQQVTQMYISHATQLVIHLTVWLKFYSLWPQLHMASFLITAAYRQTHKWSWMQVINIILTNYTMQGESKLTTLTANFIWDNGNLLVSPPFWAVRTLLPPYVSTALLLKQYTKDFVQSPLMTKELILSHGHDWRGYIDFPHYESLPYSRPPWPPALSGH